MNVHKFSAKSKIFRANMIQWVPYPNLKHPLIKVNPVTWKIFSQKEITLTPRQLFHAGLGLEFMSTRGVILTSLDYHLRYEECSLQNEISFGDVENILVAITNNSKKMVKIKENELLCFVYYQY